MADNFLYRDKDTYEYNPDDDSEDGSVDAEDTYPDLYDRNITADFRRVNNATTLFRIIKTIEQKINRELFDNERESVRQMLNNVTDPSYNYRYDPTNHFYIGNLQNWSDQEIINRLSSRWIVLKQARDQQPPGLELENVHEILKANIGTTSESGAVYSPTFIQPAPVIAPEAADIPTPGVSVDKFMGNTNRYDLLTLINPQALYSYNYLYLDSRQRNLAASAGINSFVWNEDNNANTAQGNFTYLGVVRDIIEIRVYPFRIPYPSDGSADNGFRQITLSFEELNSQSFIARNNRRFHIIFEVSIDGEYINLQPYNSNNGEFKFDKPIVTLNKLTVSFGNPINLINFDPDRLFCTFTYGVVTVVNFTEDHNLSTGDTVSFTDFNTLNPTADAQVIAEMNNPIGLLITKLTNTTFSVDVDTSTITPIPGLSIICIFDSKTFQIPVQLTFIRPDEGAYYKG